LIGLAVMNPCKQLVPKVNCLLYSFFELKYKWAPTDRTKVCWLKNRLKLISDILPEDIVARALRGQLLYLIYSLKILLLEPFEDSFFKCLSMGC
jgi:hypothetical protein